MSDISLLPEGLRGKEQAVQKQHVDSPAESASLKMHIPESTADEDIEIIEVDESDLGAILADEPLFTRISYQLSSALDALKGKFPSPAAHAPPPKLPPQFFTPPKSGLVTKAGATPAAGVAPKVGAAGALSPTAAVRSRARITPQADTPRRVRVIRRIRKSVRVSLLSMEDVLAYRADVPKRKWTFAICVLLFSSVVGGGYWLLTTRVAQATASQVEYDRQVQETKNTIAQREKEWSMYRDLQQRLTALDTLLTEHVKINRVFDFLEQYTLPGVSYRSASVSPDGTLSLSASASDYDAAARQIVALRRAPMVERVNTNSFIAEASGETGAVMGVSFQLAVKLRSDYLKGPDKYAVAASATSTAEELLPVAPVAIP